VVSCAWVALVCGDSDSLLTSFVLHWSSVSLVREGIFVSKKRTAIYPVVLLNFDDGLSVRISVLILLAKF
jgi:hypothetical protein